MSLRSEVEELAKWLSEKSQPPPAKPEPERPDWAAVAQHVNSAAEGLRSAATAHEGTVIGELARDLSREAKGLALRAHLILRRDAARQQRHRNPISAPPAPDTVVSALSCLGDAREVVIDVESPDEETARFAGDLDVLIDMTLTLCEKVS